jgi:lysophospholipase L1-like esterase
MQHRTLISKARILLARTLVTLLTLALCFVGLEALLRVVYSENQSRDWSVFHPTRGWALAPGDYWFKPPRETTKIDIHINELGFRSQLSNSGQARRSIVVLGDSFVFAKESRSEAMFSERLEGLLKPHVPDGVEVLNAGVPGYGTAQQLLFVRELYRVQNSRPDIFLLMFFTNDTLDNLCLSYGNLTPEPIRPCFTLDETGQAVLMKLPENLPDFEDDTLVAAARQGRQELKTLSLGKAWAEEWVQTKPAFVAILTRLGLSPRIARMPGLLNAWYRPEVVQNGMTLTSALITQMDQEIREKGGQLVVSMVPSPFQVYPETYLPLLRQSFPDNPAVGLFAADVTKSQRLVRELCEKAGIPFQDLLPVFSEHRENALFIPRDGHLTHAGHKLMSESLLPFVLKTMARNQTAGDSSRVVNLPSN